jgi:cold-inducible RNA-binding protein
MKICKFCQAGVVLNSECESRVNLALFRYCPDKVFRQEMRQLFHIKKDSMKNIYVGNLDYNITEQDLRSAFEPFGQVDNVTIMRDRDTGQPRGFAFVEMANDEEAQKAIAGTNGTQLGARSVNVNEARPKTERVGGGFNRGGGGGRPGGGGGGNRRGGGRPGGGGFRNRY